MDRFLAMKIFVRVIQFGSFTAVAAEMGMTQSSVSKKISALEKHLKTKLIVRNSRNMLLTEAGSSYFSHCTKILCDLDKAETQVSSFTSNPIGNLKISIPDTFGRLYIVPFLPDFNRRYPDINLDVSLLSRRVDLVREGVDVAIRIGILEDSNLIARKIGSSPRLMVASPDYLEMYGAPENIQDLQQHNCLSFNKIEGGNFWHFNYQGNVLSTKINGSIKSSSNDVIIECTLAGLGVAILPKWLVHEALEQRALVSVMQDYLPTELPIHAIYPQNKFVPTKVSCFIEYFQKAFLQTPVIS